MSELMVKEEKRENVNYVEPYYIEALGCDGLTAADIAKSLGVDASAVRRKLLKRDFMDRIKRQGFQAVTFVITNDTNGLDYEEIALDVPASKFFVGKYDNDSGDGYLAFLLRIEQKVDELDAEIKADPVLRNIAETLNMRRRELITAKKLREQEMKTAKLEVVTATIGEDILNMQLSQVQKRRLKALIDAKANAYGSIKFAGMIQRDLKEHFNLNVTNDKWYHLAQRNYEKGCMFVERWGRFSISPLF